MEKLYVKVQGILNSYEIIFIYLWIVVQNFQNILKEIWFIFKYGIVFDFKDIYLSDKKVRDLFVSGRVFIYWYFVC